MPQLSKNYGLQGEPEARLEREMENLYKTKLDGTLNRNFSEPSVSTQAQGQPILVKVAGNWYIYIRIDDKFYKAALTMV